MHPELAAGSGPERFLREIRTVARLDHPHILPVPDSGEAAGQHWYAMPYVRGESLRDRLRREGPSPRAVAPPDLNQSQSEQSGRGMRPGLPRCGAPYLPSRIYRGVSVMCVLSNFTEPSASW